MSAGMGLNGRRKHVECLHIAMVAIGEMLHYLHRFELLQTCFLGNLILALIRIVLQMSHIGDIAHIAHFIPEMGEVAIKNIKGNGRTRMS